MAQASDKREAVVNSVTNLWVPEETRNMLNSSMTISFNNLTIWLKLL
jgi:hypothetical protein